MLQPSNRTRSTPHTISMRESHMSRGVPYTADYSYTWEDTISDRVTPKHLRRIKNSFKNACHHHKETHSVEPSWSGVIYKSPGSTTPWYYHRTARCMSPDGSYVLPSSSIVPGRLLYDRYKSLVDITEPSIADILSKVTNPNKNNLGVDIAELLTAGGAIAGIAEMFDPSTILRLSLEVSRKSARGIAKEAISAHLQAIYGYLPFFDSLMKLVFSLAQFDSWASNLGSSQKVTFKRIFNREFSKGLYSNSGLGWSETVKYSGQFSCVRRYHATVYLNKTSFNPIEKFLLFLDYVDLSIDASDVWAVVPCSFVIDWFLPISDALKDFDNFASASCWSIGDTYISEKINFSSEFSEFDHFDDPEVGNPAYPDYPSGRWKSSISDYARYNWSPRISSFKGVTLPNGWQTASMAELAGAIFL